MNAITDIADRIASIASQIPSIQKVYSFPPRVLTDADLPTLIVVPSRANHIRNGEGQIEFERVYSLMLMVNNARYGVEGEYTQTMFNICEELIMHFNQRTGLETGGTGDAFVLDAFINADEGLQVITYPSSSDVQYVGTMLNLVVRYVKLVSYTS